ncbi:MAG TPA: LLM class F420-dependent oxidoreductase [Marmoricola sp.]|nr:LLM class F420-dependent oxidoreductase [Marmoricola sp.]
MDIGIHYSRFPSPQGKSVAQTFADTARIADQGGAALLTCMDHYFQMEVWGGPSEPMLEGYTALGFAAAQTERLHLGLLVTGVTYRHPGLLAKIVGTLDVLSEGRAQLGIGAAWYDREHDGLGIPFPSTAGRFERLEETLQICRQMWSDNNGAYQGQHYQLAETWCVPAPIQQRIPIMIGGSGERKTLRLVAQYADACNLFGADGSDIRHKLEVLRRHCDDLGRDYDSIRKTAMAGFDLDPIADPDGFSRRMEEYAGLGIELVTMSHDGVDPVAWTAQVLETVGSRIKEF